MVNHAGAAGVRRKKQHPNRIRASAFDRGFNAVNIILITLVLVVVAYPLLYVISASVSDPILVSSGKVLLVPKGLTLEGYQKIFESREIWRSFFNSVRYTVMGTALNLLMTVLGAYPLSRRTLAGRRWISLLFTFTMYFSGGMIPSFLVVKMLGMYNTFWALIIPGAVSTYNMIVMRSFFESSIPDELHDAAAIDGCNDTQYLLRILLPLSKPVLAVMVLFYGTGHWNAFFNAIIYLRNAADYPLQVVLRNILLKNVLSENMITDFGGAANYSHTAEIIKYGLIIVSSVPMLVMYPFVQKHFVKGVMIGSIKG